MAQQMHDIAESSKALEQSKIEVQLKIFTEQMLYQREKDLRMYYQAKAANENAHLSIQKQAEIVHCLSQLSNVLGMSLQRSISPNMLSMPKQNIANNNYKERIEDYGRNTSCEGIDDGLLQQGGTNLATIANMRELPENNQRDAGKDHRDGIQADDLPRHM